jgi:hypothetical protein
MSLINDFFRSEKDPTLLKWAESQDGFIAPKKIRKNRSGLPINIQDNWSTSNGMLKNKPF